MVPILGDKRATNVLMVVLCFTLFSLLQIQVVKTAEQMMFEDDFESYEVGSFPHSGDWEMIFEGNGTQYQVIVDDFSVSPTKSLQLLGQDYWACNVVQRITTESPMIGYEIQAMVEDINVVDLPLGRVGFWSRKAPNIGQFYTRVNFVGDGTITAGGKVLQNYAPYTWYKIKVILNKETRLYNVWIDDALLLEDHVEGYDPNNIEAFGLASEMFGSYKIYFDDVKIFTVFDLDPKLDLEPSSGFSTTTLVGSGFAPNSEISITWNEIEIHSVPNPLTTDSYGNFTAIISILNQTSIGPYEVKVTDEMGNEATSIFNVIPEFPSWIIPIFFGVTLVCIIFRKKIIKKGQE